MNRIILALTSIVGAACSQTESADTKHASDPQPLARPRNPSVDEGIDREVGKGGAADPRAAEELYEAACLADDPAGCFHFELLQRTRRILDQDKRAAIAAPFEAACDKGDMRGCYRVGMLLDDDGGLALDGARAFELFERACAGGYAYACMRAATLWLVGPPSQKPESKATVVARATLTCDAGFPGGCTLLASVVEDDAARERLHARSCELGGVRDCVDLARTAIPQPAFACDQCPADGGPEQCFDCRIMQCRRESCCPTCADRDRSACCADEGSVTEHPLVTTAVDPQLRARGEARATEVLAGPRDFLERSCERAHPRACVELARILDDDALPSPDPVRARTLFERACRAEDPAGCDGWASSLAAARGGPPDAKAQDLARAKAAELWGARCAAGDSGACWARM
jgi:TPR repeat protein